MQRHEQNVSRVFKVHSSKVGILLDIYKSEFNIHRSQLLKIGCVICNTLVQLKTGMGAFAFGTHDA